MEKASSWAWIWQGETGEKLRECGGDSQRVAFWLLTCSESTPIGLYRFGFPNMIHQLKMTKALAVDCLRQLAKIEFAFCDTRREVVWVRLAARYRIGESLKPNDGRCKGIRRDLEEFRETDFYVPFFDLYAEAFHLGEPSPSVETPPVIICGKQGTLFEIEDPEISDPEFTNPEPPKPPSKPVKDKTECRKIDREIILRHCGESDRLVSILTAWVAYKNERRQHYKPRGLQALCTQAKKFVGNYGIETLEQRVLEACASTYMGIVWKPTEAIAKRDSREGTDDEQNFDTSQRI